MYPKRKTTFSHQSPYCLEGPLKYLLTKRVAFRVEGYGLLCLVEFRKSNAAPFEHTILGFRYGSFDIFPIRHFHLPMVKGDLSLTFDRPPHTLSSPQRIATIIRENPIASLSRPEPDQNGKTPW